MASELIMAGGLDEKKPQYNEIAATSNPDPDPVAQLAPPSPRRSPRPSSPSFYDPAEWNIAELSPGGVSFSSDPSSHVQNETNNVVNAVHMHVQDNARIPNYNQAVDRTNSSGNRKNYQRNNYTFDTLLSSHPVDNSMAELFLSSESNNRTSRNHAYEVRGSISTEDVHAGMEMLDALEAAVDPTPLSEIKDKIYVAEEERKAQHASTISTATVSQHPYHSSYYPYGRHHQLPIPEKIPSPLKAEPNSLINNTTTTSTAATATDHEASRLAAAIATAAAIACTTNTGVIHKAPVIASVAGEPPILSSNNMSANNPPGLPSGNRPGGIAKPQGEPRISQNYTLSMKPGGSNAFMLQRQRDNDNVPPHAAIRTASSAAVLAAANRKSQYGFGGNHTIPSIPAQPSMRSSTQQFPRPKIIHTTNHQQLIKNRIIKPPPIPLDTSEGYKSHVFNPNKDNVSAYERKKQKAKDARIKLNESIERLAIAVSLAGSQSRHRIDQLENHITMTEFRQKSIQVNKEGIDLADKAKKWDRPQFVGTAASVIQSLNAQCEALMAELSAMQKILDDNNLSEASNSNNDTNDIDTTTATTPDKTSSAATYHATEQNENHIAHSPHKRHEQPSELPQNNQISNKRPRMEIKVYEDSPSDDEVVYGEIAKMLDPVSLCRCASASKIWSQMQAFQDDDNWLNLAVKRFGFYNVRQWSENLKEMEDEESIISNKYLYREMNASNCMPHFSQEGLSLLGNGKIQGMISGWVFLVERSNGETLRSVKRDPSTAAPGGGSYQSRPVVELRIVIQNTGMGSQPIIVKPQQIGVDISTRRRGGELEEIDWDERFRKVIKNTDGTKRIPPTKKSNTDFREDICWLGLFETAVLEVHINAPGCSTISKFKQKSNFTKLLVTLDGTTVPMVIPFLRDHNML
ncbi:hypothetical protein FRACYDRAFT_261201 [Fragilariopsis cylindrus CCMP1102]|uniref:F-box domain-containing protein n=1 Tax=Fragilariopsis cylindrus CCMP1102 TaxID=635003 RepID=A0A1E7FDR2_9STRA|nr:hypothetical protein FRACYDRAFT_261201 [Fragilariopsis cylindrus CCMP1102]|eukprot:OEU16322.1 hypothetical protein FRACYDRAFT_261201 [Fragilariopsis cylindrus CCMP1102]